MNYARIKYCDTANGPGCRTVLFVSGCRNHCKNCFQPETWDFNYGNLFDKETRLHLIESLNSNYIKGLTVLGGEPFEEENQKELSIFLEDVKYNHPSKDIWCFTGYLFDKDLIKGGRKYTEYTDKLLSSIDVLVDGPFIEDMKNLTAVYRGSDNQRIIDVRESLKQKKTVIIEDSVLLLQE